LAPNTKVIQQWEKAGQKSIFIAVNEYYIIKSIHNTSGWGTQRYNKVNVEGIFEIPTCVIQYAALTPFCSLYLDQMLQIIDEP